MDHWVRRVLDELGISDGYDPGDSANTILVQSRGDPPRFIACVVLATTRLDVNGTVRRRLGRKASFTDADRTVERTGMAGGGNHAVALPAGLPIW
ncbi:MAG: hypothetical protein M3357_16600, partial [Actinomycetota bacterium]|nr:hypothetical protein [Actinomycetota bacterium]